jgi:hypothetical protein
MKKSQFIEFANDIVKDKVIIKLQTKPGKWYECEYTEDFESLEPEKTYGIVFHNMIQFDFKTGKNPDNFFKSFVNQYVSKFAVKEYGIFDGVFRNPTKNECFEVLKNDARVRKYYFYTTLYGIGYFCFLMRNETFEQTKKILTDYLNSKKVSFKNEFSEAGWVYRFCINKDVETHNQLLTEFDI